MTTTKNNNEDGNKDIAIADFEERIKKMEKTLDQLIFLVFPERRDAEVAPRTKKQAIEAYKNALKDVCLRHFEGIDEFKDASELGETLNKALVELEDDFMLPLEELWPRYERLREKRALKTSQVRNEISRIFMDRIKALKKEEEKIEQLRNNLF